MREDRGQRRKKEGGEGRSRKREGGEGREESVTAKRSRAVTQAEERRGWEERDIPSSNDIFGPLGNGYQPIVRKFRVTIGRLVTNENVECCVVCADSNGKAKWKEHNKKNRVVRN